MKTLYFIIIYLLLARSGIALAQEIPNGDNDILWERPLNGRMVNDAKFHPINGNIIAAVNHEIWEIDPKDGHTIRIFVGGTASGQYDQFTSINISSDGQIIVSDEGSGIKGIIIWDYQTGKIKQNFNNGEIISDIQCTGLYPDNNRVIYFSFLNQIFHLNVYDIQQKKLIFQKNIYPNAPDLFSLSNDGKFIVFGFRYSNDGTNIKFKMELWDAETLTKIRNYGESNSYCHQFRQVNISNDNQYVGFEDDGSTNGNQWELQIFNTFSGSLLKKIEYSNGFSFSNDTKRIFFSSLPKALNARTDVISLEDLDTIYHYNKSFGFFRFNSNNEILTCGFDLINGLKLQFLSNKWYETCVNEPKESQPTISPNPASDYITLNIPPLEKRGLGGVLQDIRIFDIYGGPALNVGAIHELPLRIDISSLPPGVYFVRIGNKVKKFVKM